MSVLSALRQAVAAARISEGHASPEGRSDMRLKLGSPATAEKLRMACGDRIVEQVGRKRGGRAGGCRRGRGELRSWRVWGEGGRGVNELVGVGGGEGGLSFGLTGVEGGEEWPVVVLCGVVCLDARGCV